MNTFADYYNTAVDIANCGFGSIEAKQNIKEAILRMCVNFANMYEMDMNFKKRR